MIERKEEKERGRERGGEKERERERERARESSIGPVYIKHLPLALRDRKVNIIYAMTLEEVQASFLRIL